MAPSFPDVLLASVAVIAGSIGAAAGVRTGVRTGNWFGYLSALGCAAFLAGVVGQRTFPTAEAVSRLGSAQAANSAPGPWDAGVAVPLIGVHLTPLAVVGLLVAAIGLSLVLLFERVPGPNARARLPLRPLDEDDSV